MIAPPIRLTLLVGPTVPVPAPLLLAEALQSASVTHADEGRSGFQLVFQAGRGGGVGALDYPILASQLLRLFNRVVLVVTVGPRPYVLMDGIITNQQQGSVGGASTITVTGEDVSWLMDREERSQPHPGQPDAVIAAAVIARYALYGLVPLVIPPPTTDVPDPTRKVPTQQATDLAYLRELAQRHGHVFYVVPGPAPLMNVAYWGPPIRTGGVQRALSVNLGSATNVESLDFQYDALAPTTVTGTAIVTDAPGKLRIRVMTSRRLPMSSQPALLVHQPYVRSTEFRETGLTAAQAMARAQAMVDRSTDDVLTATGELSAARYGDLLQPRALVGVRGAGYSYDGLYYVKSVTHTIARGEYRQRFTLTREGLGALTPVVIP